LIQATKKKQFFFNAISSLKNSRERNYQEEDYQDEDDNILALLKALKIHIGRKKRKTIKMKMTKPCALEISHNKHREKKEEPNNGDGQKRERGLKLEVSRWLDRKGKGGLVGAWLVNPEEGRLGWFWVSIG
jgi:hypothetical protein